MSKKLCLILSVLASLLTVSCRSSSGAPDLMLVNARIFTADPARPWSEAVAIRGDRIAAVGSTAEVRRMAGPGTRVIDAGGRTIVPGINDAHIHEPWGASGVDLAIPMNASIPDVIALVTGATKKHAAGTWLSGDVPVAEEFETSRLTRDLLDAIAPDHPVRLSNLAGHVYLVNSAGLRAWNLSEDVVDPPGGRYGRSDGRLTGLMYEHAGWGNMSRAQALEPDESIVRRLRSFSEEAVRFGITSVQSMPSGGIERMRNLELKAGLPLRWRWIDLKMGEVAERPAGAVKYILDGTPMERGAAMREPYSDREGVTGTLNYSDAQLQRMVEIAATTDAPLLLHISGDLALEKLVRAMDRVRADWPARRVRVEHGDFIGSFLADAKRLGLVLVQNPSHFTVSGIMAARLGPERGKIRQHLRTPIERGIPTAIGSDGPINPWLNVMFATMRPNEPAEAITREQAVTAYTTGSAYAEFAEKTKGSIAAGMLADMAVLSQDVFTAPEAALPATVSVLTIVGGKVVYEAPQGNPGSR